MWIKVAVPVPALGLLTYSVPDGQPRATIGARAVVPLGTRAVTGIVVEVGVPPNPDPDSPGRDVKPVRAILDAEPFVPADVVALAQWTAEYYGAGVGETVSGVLPPMARGDRADAHKLHRVVSITAAGLDPQLAVTGRQREALDLLQGTPAGIATSQFAARGISASVVKRLVANGLAVLRHDRVDRDPLEGAPFTATPTEGGRNLTL